MSMAFRTLSFHKRNSLPVVISASNCIAVNFIRFNSLVGARETRNNVGILRRVS